MDSMDRPSGPRGPGVSELVQEAQCLRELRDVSPLFETACSGCGCMMHLRGRHASETQGPAVSELVQEVRRLRESCKM